MSNLQLLFKFAKPYPLRVVLSILFGLSGAVFNGVGTVLIVLILLLSFMRDVLDGKDPPMIDTTGSCSSDSEVDDEEDFKLHGSVDCHQCTKKELQPFKLQKEKKYCPAFDADEAKSWCFVDSNSRLCWVQ